MAELFHRREEACPIPGFTGPWFTTFGRLSAEQDGPEVRGTYTHKGGRIRGDLDGNVLRGTWSEPEHAKEGSFELTLSEDGNTFRGSWRYLGEAGGGEWNGVRLTLLSEEEGGSPGGWNSHTEGPLLSGPMLGEVGPSEARIWVQARDTSPLTLIARASDGSEIRASVEPRWEDWLCAVFHLRELRRGETYDYAIEGAHGRTERHTLRTSPPEGARSLRIAFGSCFRDYTDRRLTIFDAIRREGSDIFLMIGDNSYYYEPDWQTEHTMMLAQLRHRNSDPLRRLIADVPVLGVWDDHDYGPGDTDSRFGAKETSLRVFQRCWAQSSWGTEETPGVFSAVRHGPAEIFLLDGRYHRRYDQKFMLGEAQLAWFLERLRQSDAPVKLVVSASQVLPEYAVWKEWDCWRRDAPGELEAMLSAIEANEIRGVVFVSGDLHMANLMHVRGRAFGSSVGPDYWELTSSPLANDPWREPASGADPILIKEVADRANYGLVDIDLDRAGEEITLVLKDSDGATLFDAPIALHSLRTRPALA